MAEKPAFSVIIPFYNDSDHIEGALSSVAAQTVERDQVEVIVIDDCSDDQESERLLRIADTSEVDTRVVHQNTNKGPGHARNCGFRESRGKWVSFLDADDRLYPHKLKDQAEALKKSGADAVISDYDQKANRQIRHTVAYSWALQEGESFSPALAIRCGIQLGATLMKRETVEELGGFRTMRLGQDKDLFLRSVISGHKWVYHPGQVSEYTIRDESISSGELNYLKKVSRKPILLLAHKNLVRYNRLDAASSKVLADKLAIEARRWAAYGFWECADDRYRRAKQLDPDVQIRAKPFFRICSNFFGFLTAEKMRYYINQLTGRS